ncbi:Carbon catabolite repressor protein 4-like protein 2 [Hibiscus syriacus]|uniref:Carbon catabolite repressor protein 4-like protein 2 n=1 Tax=Hibiscus syriacus TaxID=106335 RepID=A0A6A3AL57_HIBSY|nr:Carbon catabolite repressor protein 4-like protein 2 [Hibiscus syriacus]
MADPPGLCPGRIANRFEDISCSAAPPVAGLALTGLQRDKTVTTDDVLESAPLDGHLLRYKWYRIQSDRKVAVCTIHPSEQATLQCLGSEVISASLTNSSSSNKLTNGSTPLYPAAVTQRSGGETWFEVGRSKTYTPTTDDIGHVLKFECVVIDAATKLPVGHPNTISTSHVIPAPSPSPRHLIPVGRADMMTQLDSDGCISSSGTLTFLSYNILSDSYASHELYSYCPSWAISWPYRRQNLLREIVGYHADIICLQEVILLYCLTIFVPSELPIYTETQVQSDHFDDFFAPELDKHGYQALYKRKTNEVYSGNIHTIDGCATFFHRDRFSHVKKYEVEFNKAAQSLTEVAVQTTRKKAALSHLVKNNVALIVVLEAKFTNKGADNPGKRQLLCVIFISEIKTMFDQGICRSRLSVGPRNWAST